VGDRGHRKGQQLRVLDSASARRSKDPRTGGPPGGGRGRGVHGPGFVFAKAPWYISKGTEY
jgi:hypothetical protein